MRLVATLLLAAALAACNLQTTPQPSPSPTSPAQSQAADLRTHLDLLFAEQVMIVAKESAAAVNHSDEYSAYTSLLATNSADLVALIARAYGNTVGVQFAQAWNQQNGFLVDYAIGVVTHNDDKAKTASTSLTTIFVPQFSQLVSGFSGLPKSVITELASTQVLEDVAIIDAVFAGDLQSYYTNLHRAYAQTSRLGDALGEQIPTQFPDKFPGDASAPAVDSRVKLNLDLQEHSYLLTMATDATVNNRETERAVALSAASANNDAMRSVVEDTRFSLAWSLETGALLNYAVRQDPGSKQILTGNVVVQLAGVTQTKSDLIAAHENANIKVVDDQRANAKSIAADDRAAATSMEPIADSAL